MAAEIDIEARVKLIEELRKRRESRCPKRANSRYENDASLMAQCVLEVGHGGRCAIALR